MGALLMLFILVPAAELSLLLRVGARIGAANTFLLIVITGILGATLARKQGLGVLASIRRDMAAGELPAVQLVDGLIILVASALLVTPGILTDGFGFLCLVPEFRSYLRRGFQRRFERAVREGRVVTVVNWEQGVPPPDPHIPPGPRVHDVTAEGSDKPTERPKLR